MQNIKLMNVKNVYVNGKKATTFEVYSLINNEWVFDYNDCIFGWFKRHSTILAKHKSFNEAN